MQNLSFVHRFRQRTLALSLLLDALVVVLVLLVDGYHYRQIVLVLLNALFMIGAVVLSVGRDAGELFYGLNRWTLFKRQALGWSTLWFLLWVLIYHPGNELVHWVVALRQGLLFFQRGLRTRPGAIIAAYLAGSPAKLVVLSFAAIIGLGTMMLTFPDSTIDGQGASLVDAFFTATSAVCVTGLVVQDTGTYFTLFGQIVILALIQVGGLGIMTLSGSAVVLFGRRLGLRSKALLASVLDMTDVDALQKLMAYIVKMTLVIESLGALLLFIRFCRDQPPRQAAYQAVFHAISAFCNAGFSTWSDSLMRYRGDLLINLVVPLLILLGGIGFTVFESLVSPESWRQHHHGRWSRMPVHVKMVLPATAVLLLFGTVGFFFFDYHSTLSQLPLHEKLLGAWFSSATARTAGFNTVDFSVMSNPTVLLMILLMFIGAAPGGTGGGIKVTTASVLVLSVRAMLQGHQEVELFGRTIPQAVVYKAVAITVISFFVVIIFFGLLLFTQTASFQGLLFETVSAFGTVGLSMNVTCSLNALGKLLIIVLMFIGRTGPLTLALAIGEARDKTHYRFPTESVLVG